MGDGEPIKQGGAGNGQPVQGWGGNGQAVPDQPPKNYAVKFRGEMDKLIKVELEKDNLFNKAELEIDNLFKEEVKMDSCSTVIFTNFGFRATIWLYNY